MKLRPLSISKGLWLISAVLLGFAGFLALVSSMELLPVMMLVFGLIMMIAGFSSIVIFLLTRAMELSTSWLLADGMLTIILAIYILCNQTKVTLVTVTVFCLWVLFSGVMRLIGSLELFRASVKSWWWLALLAMGCIVLGFVFLLFSETVQSIINFFLFILFVAQGVASFLLWWLVSRLPEENDLQDLDS